MSSVSTSVISSSTSIPATNDNFPPRPLTKEHDQMRRLYEVLKSLGESVNETYDSDQNTAMNHRIYRDACKWNYEITPKYDFNLTYEQNKEIVKKWAGDIDNNSDLELKSKYYTNIKINLIFYIYRHRDTEDKRVLPLIENIAACQDKYSDLFECLSNIELALASNITMAGTVLSLINNTHDTGVITKVSEFLFKYGHRFDTVGVTPNASEEQKNNLNSYGIKSFQFERFSDLVACLPRVKEIKNVNLYRFDIKDDKFDQLRESLLTNNVKSLELIKLNNNQITLMFEMLSKLSLDRLAVNFPYDNNMSLNLARILNLAKIVEEMETLTEFEFDICKGDLSYIPLLQAAAGSLSLKKFYIRAKNYYFRNGAQVFYPMPQEEKDALIDALTKNKSLQRFIYDKHLSNDEEFHDKLFEAIKNHPSLEFVEIYFQTENEKECFLKKLNDDPSLAGEIKELKSSYYKERCSFVIRSAKIRNDFKTQENAKKISKRLIKGIYDKIACPNLISNFIVVDYVVHRVFNALYRKQVSDSVLNTDDIEEFRVNRYYSLRFKIEK